MLCVSRNDAKSEISQNTKGLFAYGVRNDNEKKKKKYAVAPNMRANANQLFFHALKNSFAVLILFITPASWFFSFSTSFKASFERNKACINSSGVAF